MKFLKKIIENWRFWKTQFFWVGHFEFCFPKKIFFFASSTRKLVKNYVLEWMGLNFYDYDGLQPKITPPKHFSRQCNCASVLCQALCRPLALQALCQVLIWVKNTAIPYDFFKLARTEQFCTASEAFASAGLLYIRHVHVLLHGV